jgi:hypothetical protein
MSLEWRNCEKREFGVSWLKLRDDEGVVVVTELREKVEGFCLTTCS